MEPDDRARTEPCDQEEEIEASRTFILTVLNELCLDFVRIGCIKEAGPHLHRLMEMAHDAPASNEAQSPLLK